MALSAVRPSSGTSGEPKGAVLSHRAVIANLYNRFVLRGWNPEEADRDRPSPARLVSKQAMDNGRLAQRDPVVVASWLIRTIITLIVLEPETDLRSYLAEILNPALQPQRES